MDRNAILAVALISLLMTVWLVWFSPQPPEQPPVDPAQIAQESPTPQQSEPVETITPDPPPSTELRATADSALAAARTGAEEFITVETDRYEAVLSTRGATVVSFKLKNYKQFDQETPVQMVEPGQGGAIGLEFTTPASHLISTKDLYFEPSVQSAVTVADQPQVVSMIAELGNGTLEFRYTFKPDSYEIGLEVAKSSSSTFMTREGYEIVWTGGIPFAEGTGNQEAQVAAAVVHSGGEVEQINLTGDQTERAALNGLIDWVAVRNGFFTAVLIPDIEVNSAEMEGVRLDDETGAVLANHYNVRLFVPDDGQDVDVFRLYVGPIDFYEIADYGLDLYDIVDYGFGQTITRPIARWLIIPVFNFLSNFIDNYGIIIILFAGLIKLLLFPLTKSSFKSMAMMRQLQPQMNEIKEKYSDDPQKQQQAMMKMYKESGVNPIGGCLPQLLQLPILYALFRFFPSAIEIRQEGFLWSTDLSAPDVLLELPFSLPIYGAHVAGFPILMAGAMILQMRLQGTHQQQAGQMKVMMMIMPIFILVIFNQFAAGLSLYYLTYNILSAVQQKFINSSLEKEGIETKPEAPQTKGKKGSKPPRGSKSSQNGQQKASGKSKGKSKGKGKKSRSKA